MEDFDYVGAFTYSLTFVTRGRTKAFEDPEIVRLAEAALERASSRHGFTIHAYCFMPDHTHVLATGSEDSRLDDFVRLFKQLAGFAAKQRVGTPLWQISYYDHMLRREEDLDRVANYIWDNPVRAGLVESREQYPYSGPKTDAGLWQT